MQGEPIESSVNAQKARVLSPFEPPVHPTSMEPLLFPPSTTSFPAIFRDPVCPQMSQHTFIKSTELMTIISTPLTMPAISNYRENHVIGAKA